MSSYVGSFDFKNGLFPARFSHTDGMTAIATMLTPYGFIIGADGMRRDTTDNSVVTELAQKIFPIESKQFSVVFAWAGATTLVFPGGTSLDLVKAAAQFFGHLESVTFSGFSDVIFQFQTFLRMVFMMYAKPLPAKYSTSHLGRVLVLAYFEGQPCLAELSVECAADGTLQPIIAKVDCPPNSQYIVFSGSEKMYKQFAGDGIHSPDTREAAIALIRDYIQLCIDNRSTDPECVGIGGKIHVGILNSEKFDWVEAPLQAQNRTS